MLHMDPMGTISSLDCSWRDECLVGKKYSSFRFVLVYFIVCSMAEYRGDVQNGGLQMSKNRWRGDL